MKVLFAHTYYQVHGGEGQVFENEIKLCQEQVEVVEKKFYNEDYSFLKFIFSPFNFFSFLEFKKYLNKDKPDVIHLHNWHYAASPAIIYAAKQKRVPVVCTLHNYRLLCPSSTLFYDGKLFYESLVGGFPWKSVFKRVYRNSFFETFWLACTVRLHHALGTWRSVDRFLVFNENAKKLFSNSDLRIAENKIIVKPNFANDIDREKAMRNKTFLFIGRLSSEKGITILLNAFKHSEHTLIIIGDGPMKDNVAETSQQFTNISYLGFQNKNLVIKHLKSCSALIFPSIWLEGMPLTIIEAFASGTPVIASNLGAMSDMVQDGHNGLHFEPGNTNDLKNKIDIWSELSSEKKETFYANARATYERLYTPERNLNQLLSIYHSLVSQD